MFSVVLFAVFSRSWNQLKCSNFRICFPQHWKSCSCWLIVLFHSSIEVLRMQRENQQLKKTIEKQKRSSQRIIELEAENEQLQKSLLEGKTTVYNLTEVRRDKWIVSSSEDSASQGWSSPGARFSKVPRTVRARNASCQTAIRLLWKADF